MNKKQQIEIGKALYSLFLHSALIVKELKEKKEFIEMDLYAVRGVDYSKTKTVAGSYNSERAFLHKLEKKDCLEKRMEMFEKFMQMAEELMIDIEEDELTPYMHKSTGYDIGAMVNQLNYSERTIYRKMDTWYADLTKMIVYGK